MRVAVISDTHLPRGQRRLPDACLAELRQADLILHAGDIATVAVLEEIEAIGPPVRAVRGNVDEPSLHGRIPEALTVDADGVAIAMLHDAGPRSGRRNRLRRRFSGARVIVFGHSHIPFNEDEDGLLLFNAGSPTWKRRAPFPSMGILWIENGDVEGEIFPV